MELDLVDSIYYAIITMATVGYGDFLPRTGIEKLFATSLALAGVALLAYIFNIMLTNVQERNDRIFKGSEKIESY